MNAIPILAAAKVSISEALPHLAGMLMVMVVLAILWGLCSLTAVLVKTFLPEPAAAPVPKTSPKPVAAKPAVQGIAPEVVAVIAAAVASTTGKTGRIVSIKPMSTSWEKAGRQSVLTSHRIR